MRMQRCGAPLKGPTVFRIYKKSLAVTSLLQYRRLISLSFGSSMANQCWELRLPMFAGRGPPVCHVRTLTPGARYSAFFKNHVLLIKMLFLIFRVHVSCILLTTLQLTCSRSSPPCLRDTTNPFGCRLAATRSRALKIWGSEARIDVGGWMASVAGRRGRRHTVRLVAIGHGAPHFWAVSVTIEDGPSPPW